MNKQADEALPQTANDLSTTDERKNWTKPALERFDIASVTQNAGWLPVDDGDHAPAQS